MKSEFEEFHQYSKSNVWIDGKHQNSQCKDWLCRWNTKLFNTGPFLLLVLTVSFVTVLNAHMLWHWHWVIFFLLSLCLQFGCARTQPEPYQLWWSGSISDLAGNIIAMLSTCQWLIFQKWSNFYLWVMCQKHVMVTNHEWSLNVCTKNIFKNIILLISSIRDIYCNMESCSNGMSHEEKALKKRVNNWMNIFHTFWAVNVE